MAPLSLALLLVSQASVHAFGPLQARLRPTQAVAASGRTSGLLASAFEPLKIEEKVAFVRAVNNASYIDRLASNSTATWGDIRAWQPDLATLSDDTLDAAYAELKARDTASPLPSPDANAGLGSGAVPLAFLALAAALGIFTTGGDLLCGSVIDSSSPSCVEKATRSQ